MNTLVITIAFLSCVGCVVYIIHQNIQEKKKRLAKLKEKNAKGNMRYIVHLKYPLMYWNKDYLAPVRKLDFPREPHIITQDEERYVELPRCKYEIDEDPTRGSMFFVPITYYSLDDTPDVDLEQSATEEK